MLKSCKTCAFPEMPFIPTFNLLKVLAGPPPNAVHSEILHTVLHAIKAAHQGVDKKQTRRDMDCIQA